MSHFLQPLLQEIEQEGHTTRRLLERLPADKLDWRPHPRSMTLGQLALHVASAPGGLLQALESPELDVEKADFRAGQPGSREQVLAAFDASMDVARKLLPGYDEARAAAPWRLRKGAATLLELPRAALLRMLVCSHVYHHRGQLTVYLRLLEVSLPPVYGPSADENPFG